MQRRSNCVENHKKSLNHDDNIKNVKCIQSNMENTSIMIQNDSIMMDSNHYEIMKSLSL